MDRAEEPEKPYRYVLRFRMTLRGRDELHTAQFVKYFHLLFASGKAMHHKGQKIPIPNQQEMGSYRHGDARGCLQATGTNNRCPRPDDR